MAPPASVTSAQHGISTQPLMSQPLTTEELRKIDAYWRAANYLSVGQIYLYANPLLREPLKIEHIKPRLLGHFGTTPGLNFIYRFHLAGDVVDRVPRLQKVGGHFKQLLRNKLVEHKQYIRERGDDLPAIRDWTWPY